MRPAPPRAFTLIETLAVVALLAVLTAAVAVSLSGVTRSANLDAAVDRLVGYDRSTRDIARRFGRHPSLRFELNRGTVSRAESGDDAEGHPRPLALGDDVRVAKLVVRGEAIGYGEVAVPFSDAGRSPSYAVLLRARSGERWIVFAGLSGQPTVLQDERQVQDILAPADAARADAR